jgi:hypothetical protein
VELGEEALDLLALGATLPQRPGSRERVAPGDGLGGGAEGTGPDDGPRGVLLHEGERYGRDRGRHIVKIE